MHWYAQEEIAERQRVELERRVERRRQAPLARRFRRRLLAASDVDHLDDTLNLSRVNA